MRQIDTGAAAEYLGVPAATLAYWRSKGRGPSWSRMGKHVRYDERDLEGYVERKKVVPL